MKIADWGCISWKNRPPISLTIVTEPSVASALLVELNCQPKVLWPNSVCHETRHANFSKQTFHKTAQTNKTSPLSQTTHHRFFTPTIPLNIPSKNTTKIQRPISEYKTGFKLNNFPEHLNLKENNEPINL
jgi:hypothetical protein